MKARLGELWSERVLRAPLQFHAATTAAPVASPRGTLPWWPLQCNGTNAESYRHTHSADCGAEAEAEAEVLEYYSTRTAAGRSDVRFSASGKNRKWDCTCTQRTAPCALSHGYSRGTHEGTLRWLARALSAVPVQAPAQPLLLHRCGAVSTCACARTQSAP